jgi:serum/glucocorticoid-regulated kinase 2
MRKQLQPPFKPSVESVYDTTNFDDEFTSEQPVESLAADEDSHISQTMQEQFRGFTYNPDGAMTDSYNSHQQASNMSVSQQTTRW